MLQQLSKDNELLFDFISFADRQIDKTNLLNYACFVVWGNNFMTDYVTTVCLLMNVYYTRDREGVHIDCV